MAREGESVRKAFQIFQRTITSGSFIISLATGLRGPNQPSEMSLKTEDRFNFALKYLLSSESQFLSIGGYYTLA